MNKDYIYRVYRNNAYLGLLPKVISEFSISQDINNGAVQLDIELGVSADRSSEPVEAILDETGDPILDESGNQILEERRPDWIGNFDSGSLIANDNVVKVYEVSTENPTGLLVFDGWITTNTAVYGETDTIKVSCLSKGVDLKEYITQGNPYTTDQSQTSHGSSLSLNTIRESVVVLTQVFTPGLGVTNVGKVDLFLNFSTNPTIPITLGIYSTRTDAQNGTNTLGTAVATATLGVSGVISFGFGVPVAVTSGQPYYWGLHTFSVGTVLAFYNSGATGTATYYNSGSGSFSNLSGNFYYVTYSNGGDTTSVFTSQDPTTMVKTIMDNYVALNGQTNYSVTSTDNTGLSVSYPFISNTVLEGIQKCLELAPSDWYWYIDPGSSVFNFKQTSATADHTFVLGNHISSLELTRTVDSLVNKILFSGGDTGSGDNLLSSYTNSASITSHGRQRLERLSDGRVTLQSTANVLSDNELDAAGQEVYQTPLVIPYSTYDISTIKVGDTVGFAGFGNGVDSLILQIARTVIHPDYIELTLGRVLPRQTKSMAEALSELTALQTLANPTAPS